MGLMTNYINCISVWLVLKLSGILLISGIVAGCASITEAGQQEPLYTVTTDTVSVRSTDKKVTVTYQHPVCVVPSEEQEKVEVEFMSGGVKSKDSMLELLLSLGSGVSSLVGAIGIL